MWNTYPPPKLIALMWDQLLADQIQAIILVIIFIY